MDFKLYFTMAKYCPVLRTNLLKIWICKTFVLFFRFYRPCRKCSDKSLILMDFLSVLFIYTVSFMYITWIKIYKWKLANTFPDKIANLSSLDQINNGQIKNVLCDSNIEKNNFVFTKMYEDEPYPSIEGLNS